MWMLSDIITIIFSLNSRWSFTCTICTALSTTFTDSNTLCNVRKYHLQWSFNARYFHAMLLLAIRCRPNLFDQ